MEIEDKRFIMISRSHNSSRYSRDMTDNRVELLKHMGIG